MPVDIEDGVEGWVLAPNAVNMEIGTITAEGELDISILLLSGLVVNVTHDKVEGEVNVHNDIVNTVAEAKKAVADAKNADLEPKGGQLQVQTKVNTVALLAPLLG